MWVLTLNKEDNKSHQCYMIARGQAAVIATPSLGEQVWLALGQSLFWWSCTGNTHTIRHTCFVVTLGNRAWNVSNVQLLSFQKQNTMKRLKYTSVFQILIGQIFSHEEIMVIGYLHPELLWKQKICTHLFIDVAVKTFFYIFLGDASKMCVFSFKILNVAVDFKITRLPYLHLMEGTWVN